MPPDYLTAVATAALAMIAGVQIRREILGSRRRDEAARRRLTGAAWLARRSCEVTLRVAAGQGNRYSLATRFTEGRPLDRLERHMREVLAVSSAVGGASEKHGARAFEHFLAAADRFNEVVAPTTAEAGKKFLALADDALEFLHDAVVELEHLAPRQPHEPSLPARSSLRVNPPPTPPSEPSAAPPTPAGPPPPS